MAQGNMDQLKKYILNIRHLTEETQLELKEYANELQIDDETLWFDICIHNSTEAILTTDDIRMLITKYRPRAIDTLLISYVTVKAIMQISGVSQYNPWGAYTTPKRKKKKIFNQETKQYEFK